MAELSHRGEPFMELAAGLEARLRRLMEIPETHRVLFLQGGAQMQFAAVPLNLAGEGGTASYVDTGAWSARAIEEARRFCRVQVAASSEGDGYRSIPLRGEWEVAPESAYLHYVANETIAGVEFGSVPDSGAAPLVSDMSSNLLSRPVDVGRFGVIYAGAQKNMGVSGLTVVLVREDLLDRAQPPHPHRRSLLRAGRGRVHGQHAVHVRVGTSPPGARMDRGGGRAHGHVRAQRAQGEPPLSGDRRIGPSIRTGSRRDAAPG